MADHINRYSSKAEYNTDFPTNIMLSEPKRISWKNQDVLIYRVDSNHCTEKDLEFVIYIPVDSKVTWRTGSKGSTLTKQSRESDSNKLKPDLVSPSPTKSQSPKYSSDSRERPSPRGSKGSPKGSKGSPKGSKPSVDSSKYSKTSSRKPTTEAADDGMYRDSNSPKSTLESGEERKKDSARSKRSGERTPSSQSDTDSLEPIEEEYIGKKKKSVYHVPTKGLFDSAESSEPSKKSTNPEPLDRKSSVESKRSRETPRKNTQESSLSSKASKSPKQSNDSKTRNSDKSGKSNSLESNKSKINGGDSKQPSMNSKSNSRKSSRNTDDAKSVNSENKPNKNSGASRGTPVEEYDDQQKRSGNELPPPDWWNSLFPSEGEAEGTKKAEREEGEEDDEDEDERGSLTPSMIQKHRRKSSSVRYNEHKKSVKHQNTSSDEDSDKTEQDNLKNRGRSVHFGDVPKNKVAFT